MGAGVCSRDQWQDLDRQATGLTDWARLNGHEVGEGVCEVGPGLTEKCPRLRRVLSEASAMVVVVEHCDRLARFGASHLGVVLYGCGSARNRVMRAVTATRHVAGEPAGTELGVV